MDPQIKEIWARNLKKGFKAYVIQSMPAIVDRYYKMCEEYLQHVPESEHEEFINEVTENIKRTLGHKKT